MANENKESRSALTHEDLPDHLKAYRNRAKIKSLINIFRNPNNWSSEERRKKTSKQMKLLNLFESLEEKIGLDKIVDHMLESKFWYQIPELHDPSLIDQWMKTMKEPFLCMRPFIMEIARKEGVEKDLKLIGKMRNKIKRAQ
ncbi:MAG: hypothetical protein CME70_18820 [Halobacteriovorax sp.]|nr:hypothetical protein [Halobacteriovorax sp.]|tara:strand:- start:437 stop:862 length:426 start_codon:yes stop_codon:yes gene_type:complete